MDPSSPTPPKGTASTEDEILPSSCEHAPLDRSDQDSILVKQHCRKGTRAKFLYENPRFINEPIRYVVPDKVGRSVGDCLDWSEAEKEILMHKERLSLTAADDDKKDSEMFTTCQRSSFLIPGSSSYQMMRKKSQGRANPIVPNYAIKCEEKISYRHDYNSRVDPNYPPRGQLHGSFVLKEARPVDDPPPQTSHQCSDDTKPNQTS